MTEAAKSAVDLKREELEKSAEETNKSRTGKGTRVKVGSTRGKNPQPISFEAFLLEQPETLPTTLQEFMELTKTGDEKVLVSYLVDGFNDAMYTAASDPVAEFVDASWPDEIQKQFRIVVRNYANATGSSIEDAVNIIKPGIARAVEASKAAAAPATA